MSCCGQKRMQWQQQKTYKDVEPTAATPVLENAVMIKYNGPSTYLIKGVTEYVYLFAAHEPGLLVDGRDASVILRESDKFTLVK